MFDFEIRLCGKNHEISGSNAYEIKGRKPICRRCHLDRQRAYDARMRERRQQVAGQRATPATV